MFFSKDDLIVPQVENRYIRCVCIWMAEPVYQNVYSMWTIAYDIT